MTHHSVSRFCSNFVSVFGCRYQPPNTSFTPLPPPCFRIAYNYSNWSISIYQDLSQRVNENSLVGCIGGETNFRFQQNNKSLYSFWLFISLFAKQTVHACVCLCLCSQTLDKKLNSVLNHYDKIMFSCLNANSCKHVISLCLKLLWFCPSVSPALSLTDND